jgi:tetratricopeptide (TPR) repeat protein
VISLERGAPAPLALEFLYGRGFIVLCSALSFGAATLNDCKLEVPELRGLVDIGGSLARFRRTRTLLHEASATIRLGQLAFGHEPEDELALGLFPEEGRIWLVAEVRHSESSTTQFAAEVVLGPAESGVVQFVATELVAFGDVAGPACTALQRLIAARLSSLDPAVVRTMRSRPSALSWDVGRWIGLCTVAQRGWKLPGRGRVGPIAVSVVDDEVSLRVGAELTERDRRASRIGAATNAADDALEVGDTQSAIEALREASLIHGQDRLRAARLADLLIASGRPAHVTEATSLPLSSIQRASLECRVAAAARDGAAVVQALGRAVESADAAQHLGASVAARIALARQLALRNDSSAVGLVRDAARIASRHPVVRRAELAVPRLLDDAGAVDTTARVRRLAERAAIQSGDHPRVVEFGDAASDTWGEEDWNSEDWEAVRRQQPSRKPPAASTIAASAANAGVRSSSAAARSIGAVQQQAPPSSGPDAGGMATRDVAAVPDDHVDQRRTLLQKARSGGDDGEVASALVALADVTTDGPAAAVLFAEAGSLFFYELEDEASALTALERARELDQDGAGADYAVLSALESLYEDTSDSEGLLRIYDAKLAQAQEPEVRRVFQLTMAGVLLNALNRPERALPLCDEVIREDARSVPGRRTRAKVLEALGRRRDAAVELDRILAMPELDAIERHDVLRDAAKAWMGSEPKIAEERFAEILSSFPADTEALAALKHIRGERGDWAAYVSGLGYELGVLLGHTDPASLAVAKVRIADVPSPLRTTAASIIAEAAEVELRQRGHAASAIEYLLLALRLSPEDPTLWETLAEAARDAGDDAMLADALEALLPHLLDSAAQDATAEEALAARRRVSAPITPASEDPAARLAVLMQQAQDGYAADAVSAVDKWLPDVRDAALRRTLLLKKATWLTRRLGDPAAGLLPLKGALILAPDSVETRCVLLETYAALGRSSGAQDQMREIVTLLATTPLQPSLATEVAMTFARWCASSVPPRDGDISNWLDEGAIAWRGPLEEALLPRSSNAP